ncbi:antiviral reverse transcriptase Drt3a [Halomonas denitrificans]|uniref:antiviral reverse transcriptase Drt3a n=1 Tax=Halomonas denitrificans TaxID=370769 RepID=UPI001C99DA49|nr:antiviral reverse transcriptase Drt3a [Halomonas denitrificans]MBY5968369.1 RNA-directed DNA polymerase [Halomonas denitrificans]
MYEQSFSQKNLRRIFDDENKKGRYLESEFLPEIEKLSKKVKSARQSLIRIRKKKTSYSKNVYEKRRNRILAILRDRKNNRSEQINKELHSVATSISKKSFMLNITPGAKLSGRATFRLGNTVEEFFASKQLQRNINIAFGTKQSCRHYVIPQLATILQDNLPKIVVRTDISRFYENLNHNKLFDLIKSEGGLSLSSKKMLRKLLSDYSRLSETPDKGVPRGVGVSAYLSEIYMTSLDEKLNALEDIIYYARYVDDMVLVFCPPTPTRENKYLALVKSAIESCSLEVNLKKTEEIDLTRTSKGKKFDFLGYNFHKDKEIHLDLSRRKLEAYQEKMDIVFEKYTTSNRSKANERILINRIRFLTGNTKLSNNKGGAFVGIYFSNKFINQSKGIDFLDTYLESKINVLQKATLRRRLRKLTFSEGFNARTFRKFTTKELSAITRVWK